MVSRMSVNRLSSPGVPNSATGAASASRRGSPILRTSRIAMVPSILAAFSRRAYCESMPGLLYIKTFGCQMNEYDSGKMRDVLETTHGMTRYRRSGGGGRAAGQHLLGSRKSPGKGVLPVGRMAAVQAAAPARGHRGRRLRGEPGGRGDYGSRAVRRPRVRAADSAPPARDDRRGEAIRPSADRHQLSRNREVRPAAASPAHQEQRRSSPSWRAAASTAVSAWCLTRAARRSAAPSSRYSRK